jgi:hypothetical protein
MQKQDKAHYLRSQHNFGSFLIVLEECSAKPLLLMQFKINLLKKHG